MRSVSEIHIMSVMCSPSQRFMCPRLRIQLLMLSKSPLARSLVLVRLSETAKHRHCVANFRLNSRRSLMKMKVKLKST
jgi:hypothetical protein